MRESRTTGAPEIRQPMQMRKPLTSIFLWRLAARRHRIPTCHCAGGADANMPIWQAALYQM